MMLKKSRCLVLVMALILVFLSCTTFAAKKPIKLVYGSTFAKDHFLAQGDFYFKELVEKNSKGQIIIDYYPQLQLGTIPEQVQALKTNAQQMFMCGPGILAANMPKLGTFDLPYLYQDQNHFIKVAKSFTSLVDQKEFIAKTNTRVLGVPFINTPRQLTSKFPINKVEDVKGLKIRLPEIPIWLHLWRNLGAIITVLPASDTYTALATGTVDAQENPLAVIYTWKFHEQTKYCAMTNHLMELELMVINNDCWKSLTKTQQKILTDAQKKCSEWKINAALKNDAENKKLLEKEGMRFTYPNLAPFREKAKPILEQYGDKELLKKIEAIK
jgi:tripartite ATP-independent transporter DctP family solute receptor